MMMMENNSFMFQIYKSTKCHDLQRNEYCPRGPFCAFAHSETESSIGHDFNSLAQTNKLVVVSNRSDVSGGSEECFTSASNNNTVVTSSSLPVVEELSLIHI